MGAGVSSASPLMSQPSGHEQQTLMTDPIDLAIASRLAWRRQAEEAIELLKRWMNDDATMDQQAKVVEDTRSFLDRHS